MKETFYFPHDYNSRNDIKILRLRREKGNNAYGVFWMLIEIMHENELPHIRFDDIENIAVAVEESADFLKNLIDFCIEIKLFVSDGERFASMRAVHNKVERDQKREQKREAGKKGMANRWGNNNSVITPDNSTITKITKERKGKEKKGKEKKQFLDFVFLTEDEERKLKENLGNLFDEYIERLNAYIGSSGKKYKSHYYTILSWLGKDGIKKGDQKKNGETYTTSGRRILSVDEVFKTP